MMLQTVLNTKVYLGSSAPFDTYGDDTYQLPNWATEGLLESINFIRDEGTATAIRMQLYDKDAESTGAKLLFEDTLDFRTMKTYNPPVKLFGVKKPRIYVRLIALDGQGDNHCKLVLKGRAL